MKYTQLILFVVQLALLHSAQSKKICDFDDSACTTTAARNAHKIFIAGVEGVVESSDPIHIDEIKDVVPLFTFQFTNASMTGLTNCQVIQLKLNDEKSTFQCGLLCPRLLLNHRYNVEGFYGPVEAIGKGESFITLNDYVINFTGEYEKFTAEKDQKVHLRLKEYDVTFELRGTMSFDIQGPLHSDEAKSKLAKDYIYGHLNDFEKLLRSPIITSYMAKFAKNYNDYLNLVSYEDIFFAP